MITLISLFTVEGAIIHAPAAERLIKSGIPTENLVADVVVDKYALHKPLYRQAQIMRLQGLPVDRSTLAGWVGAAAAEIKPVYLRMKEIVLASAKIVVDETRAPVLDPGRGRTKTGYFWAISRDSGAGKAHQQAFRIRRTSRVVLIRIRRSSQRLQFVIYQRSSFTRSATCSMVGVGPRAPLHCAQPVMPGLT